MACHCGLTALTILNSTSTWLLLLTPDFRLNLYLKTSSYGWYNLPSVIQPYDWCYLHPHVCNSQIFIFFAISYTPNNNTLIETLTLMLLRLLLNFGPSITFLCFFANLSSIYSSSDLSVFPQPVHKILSHWYTVVLISPSFHNQSIRYWGQKEFQLEL